ncbi:hypothetical protein ACX9NE_18505 [Mycobacterium sp. ML4]
MPYQGQISGLEMTPDGRIPEWVEINPETGAPVHFDGRTQRGPQLVYLDAKDGYEAIATHADRPWGQGQARSVLDTTERQLAALPDGAILEIHVSSPLGAAAIRQLLADNRIFDVSVFYTPKLP